MKKTNYVRVWRHFSNCGLFKLKLSSPTSNRWVIYTWCWCNMLNWVSRTFPGERPPGDIQYGSLTLGVIFHELELPVPSGPTRCHRYWLITLSWEERRDGCTSRGYHCQYCSCNLYPCCVLYWVTVSSCIDDETVSEISHITSGNTATALSHQVTQPSLLIQDHPQLLPSLAFNTIVINPNNFSRSSCF